MKPGNGSTPFLAALVLAALALRLPLLQLPGNVSDISVLASFGAQVATHGVHALFDPPALSTFEEHFTYPPLVPVFLGGIFRVWAAFGGELAVDHDIGASAIVPPYPVVATIVKLLATAGDLAVGLLLFHGARYVVRGPRRLVPAGLYLFAPSTVYTSAVWGQIDSLPALCVLAALVSLVGGRASRAWRWVVIGALVKPQALVVGPVVALWTLRHRRWRTTALAAASALALALALAAPFWMTGRAERFAATYLQASDAYPRITVGAFNAWLVAEKALGVPLTGRSDTDVLLGALTFRHVGLIAFASVAALLIARSIGRAGPEPLFTAAAGVYFSFFMLSTQMHERYFYLALPLICLLVPRSADQLVVYALCAGAFVLNLVHVLPWAPSVTLVLDRLELSAAHVAFTYAFAFLYFLVVTVFARLAGAAVAARCAALALTASLLLTSLAASLGPHVTTAVRPTAGSALTTFLIVFGAARTVVALRGAQRLSNSFRRPIQSAP